MARLRISYSDVYTLVSNFLGLTTTGTAPSGTNLTTCQSIVARGYRDFLYPVDDRTGEPYDWNFLKKYTTFKTVSGQWKYALPVDFSDIMSDNVNYDVSEDKPPLERVTPETIIDYRNTFDQTNWPEFFAINNINYDLTYGTIYELMLYPTPGSAYVMNYWYRFDPLKPSTSTDILVGGIRASEAILECCLAIAEQQEDDVVGIHTQRANMLVQRLIRADSKIKKPKIAGNLYKPKIVWPPERDILTNLDIDNIYS